jgi:hypothetical protein
MAEHTAFTSPVTTKGYFELARGSTGAIVATRFVGGTASGAPTTGTFKVGDFIVTQAGSLYICTAAGTPGTWVLVGNSTTEFAQHNTIARTNTTAKALFTLPANSFITSIGVYVPVASDSATSADISVGKSGSQQAYLDTQDVKGAGTGLIAAGAKTIVGSVGSSAVPVTGLYRETGAASTGGPYTVIMRYLQS